MHFESETLSDLPEDIQLNIAEFERAMESLVHPNDCEICLVTPKDKVNGKTACILGVRRYFKGQCQVIPLAVLFPRKVLMDQFDWGEGLRRDKAVPEFMVNRDRYEFYQHLFREQFITLLPDDRDVRFGIKREDVEARMYSAKTVLEFAGKEFAEAFFKKLEGKFVACEFTHNAVTNLLMYYIVFDWLQVDCVFSTTIDDVFIEESEDDEKV